MRSLFTAPVLLLLVALLSCSARAQEAGRGSLSGRFSSSGIRLEEPPANGFPRTNSLADREAHERSCKTIDEWTTLVTKARSMKFRGEAMGTLVVIAQRNESSRSERQLLENEANDLRQACIRIAEEAKDEEAGLKVYALEALLILANKECIPVFNRLLEDRSNTVTAKAIAGIGKVGDDSSVRALHDFLAKDPTKRREGSGNAIKALGTLKSPAAREALEDIYKNSPQAEYKEMAGYQLDVLDAMK